MNSTRKIKLGLKRILSSLLCLLMITPYLPTINVHAEGESKWRACLSCDEDVSVDYLGLEWGLLELVDGEYQAIFNSNTGEHAYYGDFISPSGAISSDYRYISEFGGDWEGSKFDVDSTFLSVKVASAGLTIDRKKSHIKINGVDMLPELKNFDELCGDGHVFEMDENITSFDIQIHFKNKGNGPENGKFRVNVTKGDGIPEGIEPKLRVFFTKEYYDEETGEEKEIVLSDEWYSTTDWVDIPSGATHATVCVRDLNDNDYDKYFQNGYVEVFNNGTRLSKEESAKANDLFDRFRDPILDVYGYPVKDEDGNEIQCRLYKFELDPYGEESYEFPVVFSYTRSVSWSYRPEDADNDNYVDHCKLYLLDAEGNMRPYVDEAQSKTEVTKDFANYQLTIGQTYYFKIVPDYGYQIVGLNINGQTIIPDDDRTGVFKFVMSDSNFHLKGVVEKAGNIGEFNAQGIGEVKIDGNEIKDVDEDVFDFNDKMGGAIRLSTNDNTEFDLNDDELDINPVTVGDNVVDVEVDDDKVTIGDDEYSIGKSIDINVDQVVSKGNDDYWDDPITETDEDDVTVSFTYPGNAEATYKVAREHDGVVDILDATYANGILSFDTDRFSTFTILTTEETPNVEFKFGEKTNDHYVLGDVSIIPIDNDAQGLIEKDGKYYYSGKGGDIEFRVLGNKEDVAKYKDGFLKAFGMSYGSRTWIVQEPEDGVFYVIIPASSEDENGNVVFPVKELLANAENGVVQFTGGFEVIKPAMQVVCDDEVSLELYNVYDNTNIVEGEDGLYYIDELTGDEVVRFNVREASKYSTREAIEANGWPFVKNASWRLVELREENGKIVKYYPSNSVPEALKKENDYYELGIPYSDEATYGIEVTGTVIFTQGTIVTLPGDSADDFEVRLLKNSVACELNPQGGKSYHKDCVTYDYSVEGAGSEVTLCIEPKSGLNKVSKVIYDDKEIKGKDGKYTIKLNKGAFAYINVETEAVQKLYIIDDPEEPDVAPNEFTPDKNGVYNLNYHQKFSLFVVKGTKVEEKHLINDWGTEYESDDIYEYAECVPNYVNNAKFWIGDDEIQATEDGSIAISDEGILTTSGDDLDALGKKITIKVKEGESVNCNATIQFSQPIMGVKIEKATKKSLIHAISEEGEEVDEERFTIFNEYAKDGSYKVTFYSDEDCKNKIDVAGLENIKVKRFDGYNYQSAGDIDFGYLDGDKLVINANDTIKNYVPGEACLIAFFYDVEGDETQIGDSGTGVWMVKFTDPGVLTAMDPLIKGNTPTITANPKANTTSTVNVKLGLSKGIKASDNLYYKITLVKKSDSYDGADSSDHRMQTYNGEEVYFARKEFLIPSSWKEANLKVSDILKDYDGWEVYYGANCQLVYQYLDHYDENDDPVFDYKPVGLNAYQWNRDFSEYNNAVRYRWTELITSSPAYETKLGITKGTTKIYTGQNGAYLGCAKFTTTTTVKKLERVELKDSNGVVRSSWRWDDSNDHFPFISADNSSGEIYLDTVVENGLLEPGKYTVVATAISGGGVPATATLNVDIVAGIDYIELSAPSRVVKTPEKKLSFKATATTYSSLGAKNKPDTSKVSWSLVDSRFNKIDESNPFYGKVSIKNGTVTLDSTLELSGREDENVFGIVATAADYEGNVTSNITFVMITSEYQVPTTIMFLRDVWGDDGTGEWVVTGSEPTNITEDAIKRKDIFTTRDINDTRIRVLDQNNEDMDPGSYSLKISGAQINDEGRILVSAPGKNVNVEVTSNDGGKKTKTLTFKVDYTNDDSVFNAQVRDCSFVINGDWFNPYDNSTLLNGATNCLDWAKGETGVIINDYPANKPIYIVVSGCDFENDNEDGYYESQYINHTKPKVTGGKVVGILYDYKGVIYKVVPTDKETTVTIIDNTKGHNKDTYTYNIKNNAYIKENVCSIKADKSFVVNSINTRYAADFEVANPNTVSYTLNFKNNGVKDASNAVMVTFDDLCAEPYERVFGPMVDNSFERAWQDVERANSEGLVFDLDESKKFTVEYFDKAYEHDGEMVYESISYNVPAGNYTFYVTPGKKEGDEFTPLGQMVKMTLAVKANPKANVKSVTNKCTLAYTPANPRAKGISSIAVPTATNVFGVNQDAALLGKNDKGKVNDFSTYFKIEASNMTNGDWTDSDKLLNPATDTYNIVMRTDEGVYFDGPGYYEYKNAYYPIRTIDDLALLKEGVLGYDVVIDEQTGDLEGFYYGPAQYNSKDTPSEKAKKNKQNMAAQKQAYKQWVKDNCNGYVTWNVMGYNGVTQVSMPVSVNMDKFLEKWLDVMRNS